ncbi:hypothetical protein [Amycolatopsis sp. H20-H5]|uniref:hypothetical protein n=1 Tax=Amycolatopsis sp. H20-H5 TaxID=3046309 RepID=UPI002DBE4AFE|nr:hypothetical protein [Amycolatopsis sp. H20-H5]MEC3977160.1 hypothetical protein [Amycolatopsis sp. H20-H5]
MRYWLVRADQHESPFGSTDRAVHRIVCGSPHDGPDCQWRTSEVGDLVALVRIRNRSPYESARYTPGVVAFGHVSDTGPWGVGHRDDRRQGSITYDDFFFDAPISLYRMTVLAEFEPSMFHLSTRTCGFGSPLPLSTDQWDAVTRKRTTSSRRIAPRTRWDITPGDDVAAADLQEHHQVRWSVTWNPHRIVIGEDGAVTRPADPRNADVIVSNHTPNLFVFGDASARNIQPAPEGDGSILIWVERERANNRILGHISAGRALRLFTRPIKARGTARYIGQYLIDQHNPAVTDPPATKATGRCLRVRPWGPVHQDPALWRANVGQRYRSAAPLDTGDGADTPATTRSVSVTKIRAAAQAHRNLQNQLADFIADNDLEPLTPTPDDPQFDVAFWHGLNLVVCEVKSLPSDNEDGQLREGFGQLCHYAERYRIQHEDAHPVLYVERQPRDPLWESLCRRHAVVLAWPDTIGRVLSGGSHAVDHDAVLAAAPNVQWGIGGAP